MGGGLWVSLVVFHGGVGVSLVVFHGGVGVSLVVFHGGVGVSLVVCLWVSVDGGGGGVFLSGVDGWVLMGGC